MWRARRRTCRPYSKKCQKYINHDGNDSSSLLRWLIWSWNVEGRWTDVPFPHDRPHRCGHQFEPLEFHQTDELVFAVDLVQDELKNANKIIMKCHWLYNCVGNRDLRVYCVFQNVFQTVAKKKIDQQLLIALASASDWKNGLSGRKMLKSSVPCRSPAPASAIDIDPRGTVTRPLRNRIL